MIHHKRKSILVDPDKNVELQIIKHITNDFNEFKRKNELNFCGMQIQKIMNNSVDVYWTTTVKHTSKLEDCGKIIGDFINLLEINPDENCQISKITCQENCYIVEFTIYKTYDIKYEIK